VSSRFTASAIVSRKHECPQSGGFVSGMRLTPMIVGGVCLFPIHNSEILMLTASVRDCCYYPSSKSVCLTGLS
jgi:hypothetical protein